MVMAPDLLFVAIGAVTGACMRHSISEVAISKGLGPWHITGINIVGSGFLGVSATHPGITPKQRALFGVGFCGAFTTFSTFSVDVVKMVEAEQFMKAFSYVSANNIGSVGAAMVGMRLGRSKWTTSNVGQRIIKPISSKNSSSKKTL